MLSTRVLRAYADAAADAYVYAWVVVQVVDGGFRASCTSSIGLVFCVRRATPALDDGVLSLCWIYTFTLLFDTNRRDKMKGVQFAVWAVGAGRIFAI